MRNFAYFTAENLFDLRQRDSSWLNTAAGLIQNHPDMVNRQEMDCDRYSPLFVAWITRVMKKDPCRNPRVKDAPKKGTKKRAA